MMDSQEPRVAQRKRRPRNTEAGSQIKLARERAGLSQGELAKRAGVNQSTLQRIESEQREPAFGFVSLIAGALGLSLDALMAGAMPPIRESSEAPLTLPMVARAVSEIRSELADTNLRVAQLAEMVDTKPKGPRKGALPQPATRKRST
jgi:transcriptional regulator with XRE-family HTH domain